MNEQQRGPDQSVSPSPSTEEALPNVDLEPDPELEKIARETLGPEAADNDGDASDGAKNSTSDRDG